MRQYSSPVVVVILVVRGLRTAVSSAELGIYGMELPVISFCLLQPFFSRSSPVLVMDTPSKLLPDSPLAPEKGNVEAFLCAYGLEFTPDGKHVRWSPGNTKHPRNWSSARKAFNSSVVIFLDFFTYVSYPLRQLLEQCG